MPQVDGSRWRDRRTDLDLSTAAAAAALGMPESSLRSIEGRRGRPVSMRVIKRAARLYARSVDWLQGEDDDTQAEPEEGDTPRREPSGDPKGPKPRRNGERNRRGPARDSASLREAS